MNHEIELSKYWCPRKDCRDYGKTGKGNIIIKEKYGKEERYLLKCKTCKHCFSETRGTAFFCLHAPKEISHHEGKRTIEDAQELFKDVERRRSIASPIPVFTCLDFVETHTDVSQ